MSVHTVSGAFSNPETIGGLVPLAPKQAGDPATALYIIQFGMVGYCGAILQPVEAKPGG